MCGRAAALQRPGGVLTCYPGLGCQVDVSLGDIGLGVSETQRTLFGSG